MYVGRTTQQAHNVEPYTEAGAEPAAYLEVLHDVEEFIVDLRLVTELDLDLKSRVGKASVQVRRKHDLDPITTYRNASPLWRKWDVTILRVPMSRSTKNLQSFPH